MKLLYHDCIMILVEVMVPYLFYLLLLTPLFCILEQYIGTCGNALNLVKSYFSNRTQRILSEFANIICGVPQGSVLGPLKLCWYL